MILFRFDVSALLKKGDNLNRFQKVMVQRYVRGVFEKHRPKIAREIDKQGFSGRPMLYSWTGKMRNSIKTRITTTPKEAALRVLSTHPGIAVQTYGATITPKAVTKLALPFSHFDRTPPTRATHWVVALPDGRVFLKSKTSKRFTHALRSVVHIPGRLDINKILKNYVQTKVVRDMADTLIKHVWEG